MQEVDKDTVEISKRIFGESDIPNFKRSVAYERLVKTLLSIAEKVKGCDVPGVLDSSIVTRSKLVANIDKDSTMERNVLQSPPEGEEISTFEDDRDLIHSEWDPSIKLVLNILEELKKMNDETPLSKASHRFGNPAFKAWYAKMKNSMNGLLKRYFDIHEGDESDSVEDKYEELGYYFSNSFGSNIRIDYGTGHELSYIAFIGALIQADLIDLETVSGTSLLAIFAKYYDLVRSLILKFNLEPAGSHGVWGLDDHFHYIYILGAAQFDTSSSLFKPSVLQVLSNAVIDRYKLTNLYVNAVAFIFKIKLGPFNEHSPILYDIHRTVSRWSKVLSGLLKMYEVEVLSKFPVVQHFYFGRIYYPWVDSRTKAVLPSSYENSEEASSDVVSKSCIENERTNEGRSNFVPMTKAPW